MEQYLDSSVKLHLLETPSGSVKSRSNGKQQAKSCGSQESMVTQQGSNQRQFRVSASVAPRSTKPPNGDFSSLSALSEAPIKIQLCTGVVEIEDNLLLKQNPAELTTRSRYLGSITYSTRRNVLYTVEEEILHSSGSPTTVEIRQYSASAHAERLKQISSYSHSLRRKTTKAQYGRGLSTNYINHSLTCTYLQQSSMSILHSAPGTPPELTDSHSTTDSSVTSNVSTTDDFSEGGMNFEDINLQDENHKTEEIERKGNRNAFVPYKKPSTTRRPALATIQTQQTSRTPSDRTIKSAALPSSKRNFTSPSIAPSSSQKSSRTHSESPSLHKSRSVSRLGQFSQSPSSSLNVPGRRGSWQPARKTIYEIEAEYHDSDDELPDDASLFNVPMSPFARGPRTAPLSARSSARTSPERASPTMSPAPIPLGHSRTAPERPPMDRAKSRTLPRQRLTPRSSSNQLLKLSTSVSPSPQGDLRYGRTRSWNLVMADLDHEARVIAEKLDFHHEAQSKSDSVTTNSYRSSAPGAIPLPPIQRGTLDFMPMSKEKEAVLSRTRPSWLPPKDPREEQRHLEEYKKMMKASLEADKRRQEKMREQHCTTDATRDSLHRVWTYYVDPTTDIATIDNRVDGLCWRGIPPKLRGAVWQRKVGNPLGLAVQDYRMALLKVKEIKSRPADRRSKQDIKMHKCFEDIEKDAETAFPDISIFQRNGPQWQDLIDVCEAYTICCDDPGYSYGVQLVAAMILLQIPTPSEALIFMANCLRKPLAAAFLSGETATKMRTYSKVKSTLEIKSTRLHAYLFSTEEEGGLGFTGEELFEPMFHTVFANGLDLDRLCRVWDIWIFENDRYLTRTAVALLGSLETQIFDIEGDVHLRKRNIQELLGWGPFERVNGGYWNLAASGNGDTFVESIRKAGKLDCVGE